MTSITKSITQRDKKAIGSLISAVEEGSPEGIQELDKLYPLSGSAYVIGITGPPGTGKSTIISRLIEMYLARGVKVAVIAVDPTSPFSGGAVLGDRVRMQESVPDENLFIRSMGSGNGTGGLSPRTAEVVTLLDAAGFDSIIIETVGSGQDEVAVKAIADTVVVTTAPGLGDGIQAIKAGIYEIADILVVNKGDLKGAPLMASQLELAAVEKNGWRAPIVMTTAVKGEGIEALGEKIEAHRRHLTGSGDLISRRKRRTEEYLLSLIRDTLARSLIERQSVARDIAARVEEILSGKITPHAAADLIIKGLLEP